MKLQTFLFQIICLEDGTHRMFRNVGQYKLDAVETPKRKHTEMVVGLGFTLFTGHEGS
jgi:hypothetical protein